MSRMIQIRNVPDDIHGQLKARAALEGLSLSDYLLREVRRLSELPRPEELRVRLRRRQPVGTRVSAAQAVRAERDHR